jgi:very-short-patch-repair endonuclease
MPSVSTAELESLQALAGVHGGFVTTAALRKAGFGANVVDRMVRQGAMTREFRGIYRLGFQPLTEPDQRRLACLVTAGSISHHSAARYWGYLELPALPVHATMARNNRRPEAPWLVIHTTTKRGNTAKPDGITVTQPVRTVLDLAGQPVTALELTGFVDHCIARRHFTVRQLDHFLRSYGDKARGVARLRALLSDTLDTDSKAEAELVRLLLRAGIERPVTRHNIRHAGHFIGRVDLAWPRRRVALELDGFRYHAGHQAFVADRDRGNRLVIAGWTLLRTTPAAMRHDPSGVCASVAAALSRAPAA